MKISFCLITKNEEASLPRCLQSCADLADEIVVVDSGSTDRTPEIVRQFGGKFSHQDWLGYVGQKNLALSLASHEWAFSLDADEELSAELRAEVRALKQRGPAAATNGYSMPRCVLYEGRWIRHGDWYPDRLVRLFRRSRGKFAGGKVHERLEIEGPIERFKGDLHHYSFASQADHWARCEHYAPLWAETQHAKGRTSGPLAAWSRAAFRWFRGYILRAGFLDGPQGWTIAKINAREVKLKYDCLRKLKA